MGWKVERDHGWSRNWDRCEKIGGKGSRGREGGNRQGAPCFSLVHAIAVKKFPVSRAKSMYQMITCCMEWVLNVYV